MPKAKTNGLELEYESFGDPRDPTVLLIMGLGAQLLSYPEGFCQEIAARGFRAIRYDNRDVGLSTWFDAAGIPDLSALLARQPAPIAYTLADMAADAVGLLDFLGVKVAHVVGTSMGGMIAQQVAISYPERVLSLTSIMSHIGGVDATPPTPEAAATLYNRPPADRDAYIEYSVEVNRINWGPSFDEARARERAPIIFDRAFHPAGTARQFAAILAAPSRREGLRRLSMPTLVIHGVEDPLVPVENGRLTAELVPASELLLMPGVGHDLPPDWFSRLADAIAANARRGHTQVGVGVAER